MENKSLNCVRFVAAMLVVVAHVRGYLMVAREGSEGLLLNGLYVLTSFGHGAVIMFFLLSGYFVGGSVLRSFSDARFHWGSFLSARLVRLWIVAVPALLVTLVCDLAGQTFFPLDPSYRAGGQDAQALTVLAFLGNVAFLQPSVVEPFGTNHALWSLGFEFSYYLALPLLLTGVSRTFDLGGRLVALVVLAGLIAIVSRDVIVLSIPWALGAFIGFNSERIKTWVARLSRDGRACSIVVVALALVASMALVKLQGASYVRTTWGVFVLTFFSAVFICLLVDDPKPKSGPFRRIIDWMNYWSHSSYSIYAFHMPMLALGSAALHAALPNGTASDLTGWLVVLGVTALLAIVGHGFALVTERRTDPVRRRLVRLVPALGAPRRGPVPAVATADRGLAERGLTGT